MTLRIKINDTFLDVIVKLSNGNPGAIAALSEIAVQAEKIDPESVVGALGPVLAFDTYGIYGTEIYILYNDKCGRNIRKLLILLRAVQLDFLPVIKLKKMAEDQMGQINLTQEEWFTIDKQVCARLPQFQQP